jgi:hypothetical protein
MLSKEALDFILQITHHFGGHWEDPEWGRRPANQVLLLAAVNTLASGIADVDTRAQVQSIVDAAIVKSASNVGKTFATAPPKSAKLHAREAHT